MFQYNTIEEALEDLRQGKMILCTDDPDRENEGDLICAAEFATTENVNFMATHGKGLICMPMSYGYVQKLQFPQMVTRNTDNHETAFTAWPACGRWACAVRSWGRTAPCCAPRPSRRRPSSGG